MGLAQAAALLLSVVVFSVVYTLLFASSEHWNGIEASDDVHLWDKFCTRAYFATVTTTTTGYGDITPKSGILRAVVCLHILSAAAGVVLVS